MSKATTDARACIYTCATSLRDVHVRTPFSHHITSLADKQIAILIEADCAHSRAFVAVIIVYSIVATAAAAAARLVLHYPKRHMAL